MIDVHVLQIDAHQAFHGECLNSLIDQPVVVYPTQGFYQHIGKGRVVGYSQGSNEWVSFIDDDDRVLPDAFARIEQAIIEHPQADAFFTYEQRIDVNGDLIYAPDNIRKTISEPTNRPRWHSNHLMVFRRSVLNEVLYLAKGCKHGADDVLRRAICSQHAFVYLPFIGYEWRRHLMNDNLWRTLYHDRQKRNL